MSVSAAARHSAATPRWGTEQLYIDRARQALGGRIELDPMSEPAFNEAVKAARIYTAEDSCFDHQWRAETVLLNPAGGLVVEAWRKLIDEWCSGRVDRAVWIGFSVEQLALLANEHHHPLDFSWCIPRKRIRFRRHDGYVGSPSHSNYVVGIGIEHWTFDTAFGDLGRVGCGIKAVAA